MVIETLEIAAFIQPPSSQEYTWQLIFLATVVAVVTAAVDCPAAVEASVVATSSVVEGSAVVDVARCTGIKVAANRQMAIA